MRKVNEMAEKEKVVLAYSGGLDTSVIVKWLQIEKNMDYRIYEYYLRKFEKHDTE